MSEDRRASSEKDPLIGSIRESAQNEHDHLVLDSQAEFHSGSTRTRSTSWADLVEVAADVKAPFTEAASSLKEAVVEEVHIVTDAFIEELKEADQEEDKYYFLEMNLTRNFSILPADVMDASTFVAAAAAATTCTIMPMPGLFEHQPSSLVPSPNESDEGLALPSMDENDTPGVIEKKRTPLNAYFLLGTAVLALSAIGPALNLQKGVGSTLKVYWRTTATAVFLFPFAARAVHRDGMPILSVMQWIMLFITAASYAGACVVFIWGLENTAVDNTLILSNSQSLLLLVGKIFVGRPISTLEAIGACVAFCGAVLCSKDSSENPSDGGFKALKGDVFAMLSSLGGVAYLTFARTVRPLMDLHVFMFFIMLMGSLQTLFVIWVAGEPVFFSLEPHCGTFGWLSLQPDRLPLEIVMVVVCNLVGTVGYVRAMCYFDNLVITVASLMEPVVASFLAFWLGLSSLPGTKGWIGNVLVIIGTIAVVYQPGGK